MYKYKYVYLYIFIKLRFLSYVLEVEWMRRNRIKAVVDRSNKRSYSRVQKAIFNFPRINTFSDCIRDAIYKTSNKRAIHIKNENFDRLERLI